MLWEEMEWTGGIMYKFKGVGLRKVNVLINYGLMSKNGYEREGMERIVSDMF